MKNILSNTNTFLIESFKLVTFILTSVLFLTTVFSYLQFYFFPDFIFFGQTILSATNKELSMLFAGAFFLLSIVIGYELKHKKITVIKLSDIPKEEFLIYIITSFLLAYFFTTSFLSSVKFNTVVLLTLFLFLLLPYVIGFYTSYNFNYFTNLIKAIFYDLIVFLQINTVTTSEKYKSLVGLDTTSSKKAIVLIRLWVVRILNALKSLFINALKSDKKKLARVVWPVFVRLVGFIAAVFFMFMIIFRVVNTVNEYLNYQKSLRDNLTIMKIHPTRTTLAERVIINGYNFGWKLIEQDRLISGYGPVIVESWTDRQITFVVPLHWKEGFIELWVEKMKDTSKDARLLKSNKVKLQIMSRWYYYPKESDFRSNPFYTYWNRIVKKIRRELYLKGIY